MKNGHSLPHMLFARLEAMQHKLRMLVGLESGGGRTASHVTWSAGIQWGFKYPPQILCVLCV